ncbi:MAG: YqaE/Pmp3 family membrane protein [Bacteroidia bacterium]|nr:YqaE/Pmp3 family membrane protein [Bacteroidia bacterium]MDW8015797.1 YqaE/Pmp3 family membrane protein [Bacteroidia bacterium]
MRMKGVVAILGLLVLGTSAETNGGGKATAVSIHSSVNAAHVVAPTKPQKQGFLHRLSTFFTALWEKATSGVAPFSLWVLAILTPTLAVGIATNWDPDKVLLSMLLTALCFIPGLIYALIQVGRS